MKFHGIGLSNILLTLKKYIIQLTQAADIA
jgi:hypothetical protein